MNKSSLVLIVCAVLSAGAAFAQESRQLNRIATPRAAAPLPPGARAVARVQPLSAQRMKAIADQIAAAWNTPALGSMLSDNFQQKDRLLDALQVQVPRDARLRLLAVEGMQTVGQYLQRDTSGKDMLVSRVSVTARTQVEFNDPRGGFQRLEGRNELIVLVEDPAP
jgi:hypothetical protein